MDVEAPAQVPEDQPHRQRREHGEGAGKNHLLERSPGHDADAAAIVRLGCACHDAGVFAELRSHIFDDVLRRAADGFDGEGGEKEDQHRAQQRTHKDRHAGQVDVGKAPVGGKNLAGIGEALRHDAVDCLQVSGKQQKGGQRGRADGVALGQGLGGVAGRVQLVGLLAH